MTAFVSFRRCLLRALFILASCASSAVLSADEEPATESPTVQEDDPATENLGLQKKDLSVAIGVASFSLPRYSGDDDNEFLLIPNLELRYKDRLNISFLTGLSYDSLNRGRWSAGPQVDYEFGRDTNVELLGFSEIDDSLELGGFVEYSFGAVTAKVKALRGFGGHSGTFVKATVRHAKLYNTGVIPLYFLFGPALRFGNGEFLNTFYGVNEQQSTSSGLARTSFNSGLISYGFDAVLVVPLSRNVFIRNFFLFEYLTSDVAKSPIVTSQGDRFQRTFGVELAYLF